MLRVFQAIYHFLIGDLVLLSGLCLTVLVLALLSLLPFLETSRGILGAVLISAILVILGVSLRREAGPARKSGR